MAGRKRKPGGVAGFIADAISDRQKAQQLEAKAQLAWAKENAKMATADAREKARQEQREARDREIARGARGGRGGDPHAAGPPDRAPDTPDGHPGRGPVPTVGPFQGALAGRRVQASAAACRGVASRRRRPASCQSR